MGSAYFLGERRKDLCYCIGSYKLADGENEIALPDGSRTDHYFRIGNRRFIVYDSRALEDRTLGKNKRGSLIGLPKNARNALVTANNGGNEILYKIAFGGQELEFKEEVKRHEVVCLGSYPINGSGEPIRLPEGSRHYLTERGKIRFYPESTTKMRKIKICLDGTKKYTEKKVGLREVPEGATEVKITVRAHGDRYKHYQYNWE
jgi:hypothetical protein